MKARQIALAVALALGSTLAIAADPASKAERGATDGAPKGNAATDYWKQHGKSGYMTKDQAMGYKSAGGKRMDFKKLDADADGRVSQKEWTGYHTAGATKSDGSKDQGADQRGGGGVTGSTGTDSSSGAAGPSGRGSSGDGVGVNRDAPKDRDPTSGGRGSN